ncbi:subtilisin family serine protease [Actinokineospora baliensis]|uniref:S8 family peptidase n=1 Tax=Actinokineospora baliensis TaxID=547056 RepID=UPI00195DFB8C|nr:S8 family peptidase [Actinokineospora baliensis]MBM7773225.1 subtilisin family serine protease [Actinokineospora baliensis]
MNYRHLTRLLAVTGVVAGAALAVAVAPALAAPAEGPIRSAGVPGSVSGSYIVVLKDVAGAQAVNSVSADLTAQYGGQRKLTYSAALSGFSVSMSEQQARRLAADPKVAYVEQDGTAHGFGEQPNPTWGLDRIDQRNLPADSKYAYPNDGDGATVYVVDTGVYRGHSDFGGRVTSGRDFIDNDADASDCHGHGTHVAGTVGSATYGVAKKVKIVAVRVLDCQSSGQWSQIIGGFDWVAANAGANSVMTASLGGSSNSSVDDAVAKVVQKGITSTIAAGNNNGDACQTSPARTPSAITVGASDNADKRSLWTNGQGSNYGSCVDLFAPGTNILSTLQNGSSGTMSGTSMATPHVAGAAALYLTAKPGSTPSQVTQALLAATTPDKISDPKGSPNKLLYVKELGGGTPPNPGTCNPQTSSGAVAIPDAGSADSPVTMANCTGNASSSTTVKVDIDHSFTADLAVSLVGPSGAVFQLRPSGGMGDGNGIHTTYTVNASGEAKNGTWKLRVADVYRFDTGSITSWTLTP